VTAAESMLATSRANLATVDAKTRSTISTAHFAFGGHISKGLLKRGRAASDRFNTANTKHGKAGLFVRLAALPDLKGWRVTAEHWHELAEIVYAMHTWADFGDKYDYHGASRGFECWPMLEAARHFVRKYAGARIRKQLSAVLGAEVML